MSQKIRIKLKSYDHKLVDKSAEKIVKAVKATGALHREPLYLRQQEGPRAVPAVRLQASDRHLQLYRKDCRCPDEA